MHVRECVCVCACVCVPGVPWMICAHSDTWNAQNVRGGEEKRGPLWTRPRWQVTLQRLVGPWRSECSRGPVTPLKKGRRSTSTGALLSSPCPAGFFQLRREPRSQNQTGFFFFSGIFHLNRADSLAAKIHIFVLLLSDHSKLFTTNTSSYYQ